MRAFVITTNHRPQSMSQRNYVIMYHNVIMYVMPQATLPITAILCESCNL